MKNTSHFKRLNNRIISSLSSPIYSTSMSSSAYAAYTGKLYSVTLDPAILLANSNSVNGLVQLSILNPITSQKTLIFDHVRMGIVISSSSGSIDLDFMKNGTFTGTNPLTAHNMNFGYADASTTTITYVDNTRTNLLTGGTLVSTFRTPISIGETYIDIDGEIVVPPGNTFTTTISNTSGQQGSASLTIIWWETQLAQ